MPPINRLLNSGTILPIGPLPLVGGSLGNPASLIWANILLTFFTIKVKNKWKNIDTTKSANFQFYHFAIFVRIL